MMTLLARRSNALPAQSTASDVTLYSAFQWLQLNHKARSDEHAPHAAKMISERVGLGWSLKELSFHFKFKHIM